MTTEHAAPSGESVTGPRRSRLGPDFGKLWTSAAFSNLADGVGRTAVPLIATTLTRDPFAIAVIGALAFVPWFVFGIPAGMLVDRFDRRILMALANAVRAGVAFVLAVLTVTGSLDIWLLFAGVLVSASARRCSTTRRTRRCPASSRGRSWTARTDGCRPRR